MCRLFHRLALGHIHGRASRKTTETGRREDAQKNQKIFPATELDAGSGVIGSERWLRPANARIR
jgi:hypothetical protein